MDKDLPINLSAYFSPEYSPHFGWGECPHWIYDGAVRVLDYAGNPVADAVVKSSVSEGTTDSDGKAVLRLNIGRQNLYVEKDGKRYSQSVDVPDEMGSVILKINPNAIQTLSNSTYIKAIYASSTSYTGSYAREGVAYAALTKDNSLYLWGDNCDRGRLGNGEMSGIQDMPIKVLDGVADFQFSPEGTVCAAITTDGSLYTWGAGGVLGTGNTSTVTPCKVEFPSGTKIEKFSFYVSGVAAAITTDGDLYMWGGMGFTYFSEPLYIMNNVEDVYVSQSGDTFAAVTKEGSLFLWGNNRYGFAGQPYDNNSTTSEVLPSDYQEKGLGALIDGVQEVYLGYYTGAALRRDGSLWMWGEGYSSYQNVGDSGDRFWKAQQLVLQNVSQFCWDGAGGIDNMTCAAVTKAGELYMWGENRYGQLGTGDTDSVTEPKLVTGMQNVRAFHMENATCAAVTEDGKLYMWGRNEGGSVGNGEQEICSQPVLVLPEQEVNSFAFLANTSMSAALTKDKALYIWSAAYGINTPELKLEQVDKLIPYPTYYHDLGSTSFDAGTTYAKFACIQTDGSLYEFTCNGNKGYFLEDLEEEAVEAVCKVSHTGGSLYYRQFYGNVIAIGQKGSVYTWTEAYTATEMPTIKKEYFFGGADIFKPLPEEKTQTARMTLSAEASLQTFGLEENSDETDSGNVCRTVEFTGLRSNEIYNVYAMKSKTAEDAFDSDNLLHIGQSLSDDSGSIRVTFEMKESYAEPQIFCVGMNRTDLSEVKIEVSDIIYDGYSHLPEVTVSYNGQTLTQGMDYNVYFQEYAREVGEYELIVEGTGLFDGETTVKFRVIEEKNDDEGDTPGGGDTSDGEDPSSKPDYGDVLPQDVPQDGVIPTGLWIAGVAENGYDYTGSAIRPEVRVYDGKRLLIEKTDYTIAYKNNVQANDASEAGKAPTITVTGKGNYTGKDTKTFKILQLDISSESEENLFEADDIAIVCSSKAQKPVPELYWNGRKLKNRTDYTVTYHRGSYSGVETQELSSVLEPGTYYIKLTGTKNFTGTRRVKLTVLSADSVKAIAKVKVAKIPSQLYQTENKDGAVTPEVTVKDGNQTLTKDVHYTVSYSNNKKVGTAYAIIKGIEENGYSGSKRISFKITGVPINKASVTGLQTFVYGGTAREPLLTLSVKINGTTIPLVKDQDYSVQWQKNVNAGTAAVLFTGKNGYTGTMKKTFKIKAWSIAENQDERFQVEMTETSVPYAKGGARPGLTVTFRQDDGTVQTLKEGTDYTVSCKNNKTLNDGSQNKLPTLTIKGKGNFTGVYQKSLTYRITAQDISRLTLSAADKVYQNRGNIYSTKVTITDLDGKVLKAGTDYDKNLIYTYKNDTTLENGTLRAAGTAVDKTDIIPAGTVICVTAAPKGNYTGTPLTGEYSIKTYNISGAKVTIPAQIYTGKEITLDKTDEAQILVKAGGRKVDADQFEIVRYSNNVKKGTATVTIRGTGNYGGEKTVKFKIKAKGFLWWWNR